MTPATARHQQKTVSFVAPSSSRPTRSEEEEDEEPECAAGRTYKQDIAFQKMNGDEDEEDDVSAWSRYLSEPPSIVFVMPDATALDATLGPPIARDDDDDDS